VYGELYKKMELPGLAMPPKGRRGRRCRPAAPDLAKPIFLQYTCPFAFLWLVCSVSIDFYRFLEGNMARPCPPPAGQAGPSRLRARLALYFDEVVPGNNHRPDKGRAYMAVYWTFVDLPMWFINGPIGWFTLCFVPLKVLENIVGGLPTLCEALLRVFFPEAEAMNFATGVRLIGGLAMPADALGLENPSFTFAADFAFFLRTKQPSKRCQG